MSKAITEEQINKNFEKYKKLLYIIVKPTAPQYMITGPINSTDVDFEIEKLCYSTKYNSIEVSMELLIHPSITTAGHEESIYFYKDFDFDVEKPTLSAFFKETKKAFMKSLKEDSVFNLFGDKPRRFFENNNMPLFSNEEYKRLMRFTTVRRDNVFRKIINSLDNQIKKERENNKIKQGER